MNNFEKVVKSVFPKSKYQKPEGYPKIKPIKNFCGTCGSTMFQRTTITFEHYDRKSGEPVYKEINYKMCSLENVNIFKKMGILIDRFNSSGDYNYWHDEKIYDE